MSEVYNAAVRFKASLLAREEAMMGAMADRWLTVMRALEEEIQGLALTMAQRRAQGLPVTAGYIHRTQRYRALLGQAYDEFVRYEHFAEGIIARNQALFARLSRQYAHDSVLLADPILATGFDRLNVGAVETIAGYAGDGAPLRLLLEDAWPHATGRMVDELVRGVALGYGPRRIARQMADGLNGGLYRSMVIARTETQRVHRHNMMQGWRETGFVTGFQRVATLDLRTCPACLFSDGAFIESLAEFAEHPQGRCTAVPVTQRSGTHTWNFGSDWFLDQSPDRQARVLGPGRYAAWRAGGFRLRDIPVQVENDIWGPSLRTRTLEELSR